MQNYGTSTSSSSSDTYYQYTPWYISKDSVKEIVIEDGVQNIGEYAFCGCTGLTSITVPNSVTSIGVAAFSGCTNLTSITIPDGVTILANSVFYGCTGLTSITIPDGVTSIGEAAFRNCARLINLSIPDRVTSIGKTAFYGCTGLTSITIPDSVTSFGSNVLSGCTNLISIDIGNGVTKIYESDFKNLTSLKSVTIGTGVATIGDYAFNGCTGLEEMVIPYSVKSIGTAAFTGCTNLGSLTVYNRNCTFADDATAYYTTIYGFTGSTAETYANEKGFDFVAIDYIHEHVYDNDCDAICNLCGAERLVHYTLTPVNGAVVDNENGLIYGIASNSADINSYVNTVDDTMTVECDSALLGTGSIVNIVKDDVVVDSYKIVVFGDVNGDGWYDGMDAVTVSCIANGMLTKDQIGEAAYMAADCNHDGVVDEFDVAILNQAGVLLASVDQTKTQEELSADSDYVEYLNLIDQNPTIEEETQEPEQDNGFIAKLIAFIETILKYIVTLVNKIW